MRAGSHGLLVSIACFIACFPLYAQTSAEGVARLACSPDDLFVDNVGVKAKPYSVTLRTTHVQTLADGSHITHSEEERCFQDSQGRTRTERYFGAGETSRLVVVSIVDPVAHTWAQLLPEGKQAVVWKMPADRPVSSEQRSGSAETQRNASVAGDPTTGHAAAKPHYSVEVLPPKIISGVRAEGRRVTQTLPAGMDGNDRDLVTVTEEWTSPDLQISLDRIAEDPRFGKSTTQVTGLDRTEPEGALFHVPEDYRVREQPGYGP